jgi:DNA-binding Xre family transcriptional regulator
VRLRLRALLKEREITPYRLAQLSGLSLRTLYRLTRPDGKFDRIEAVTMDKLCRTLKCKPGDLFQ